MKLQSKSMVLAQKQKCRSMELDRKSRINPCICGELIYNKEGKNIKHRKDTLIGGVGKRGQLHVTVKLECSLHHTKKINSK